jgi:hypothetical protein
MRSGSAVFGGIHLDTADREEGEVETPTIAFSAAAM